MTYSTKFVMIARMYICKKAKKIGLHTFRSVVSKQCDNVEQRICFTTERSIVRRIVLRRGNPKKLASFQSNTKKPRN